MERIPPHNDEAERSVLGSALLSKDALFDVVELLTEDDFQIHQGTLPKKFSGGYPYCF